MELSLLFANQRKFHKRFKKDKNFVKIRLFQIVSENIGKKISKKDTFKKIKINSDFLQKVEAKEAYCRLD